MGALLTPAQRAECRAATGHDPLEIRIAGGSLESNAKSGPVVVIVHRDNPLRSLDAAALRAEFGDATGQGSLRPCGLPPEAPLGLFFRERALAGGAFGRGYAAYPQSADVVRAVAADPRAIGFARANVLTPAVKVLAVATEPGASAVALTAETLAAGRYPLDWHLYLALRRPVEPWIAEFARFVLSAEGQDLVARGTLGYRRLSADEAARELEKLP
jgi:phosphate transport system substrate-binding protein